MTIYKIYLPQIEKLRFLVCKRHNLRGVEGITKQ